MSNEKIYDDEIVSNKKYSTFLFVLNAENTAMAYSPLVPWQFFEQAAHSPQRLGLMMGEQSLSFAEYMHAIQLVAL